MLIDWFTVVAQTINFLILVWLLKRFLYQPILDAIDARERRIAQELADAAAKKAEAGLEREEFARKNRELAEKRHSLLSQMQDEVNSTRQKLLDDAHAAAESLSAKRQVALQREQHRLGKEIGRRAGPGVFHHAEDFGDLADDESGSVHHQGVYSPFARA